MKESKRLIAFILAYVLVLSGTCTSIKSFAKEWSDNELIASYVYADGVKRDLVVKRINDHYNKGDEDYFLYLGGMPILGYWETYNDLEYGMDKYGFIWELRTDGFLEVRHVNPFEISYGYYGVYEDGALLSDEALIPDFYFPNGCTTAGEAVYGEWFWLTGYKDIEGSDSNPYNDNPTKIKSFSYDNDGLICGLTFVNGVYYDLPDYEQLEDLFEFYGKRERKTYNIHNYMTYFPEGFVTTETPITAQDATTESSASTEMQASTKPTTEARTTREEDFFVPVVLKDGNKYTYRAYNTDYVYVANYTLSKNVLKFNGKKYKNVKYAGFVEKTASVVYITKKGQAYVVTFKGKKNNLLKKGAKKLVKTSKGFVTKIKKKSGSMNVTNK